MRAAPGAFACIFTIVTASAALAQGWTSSEPNAVQSQDLPPVAMPEPEPGAAPTMPPSPAGPYGAPAYGPNGDGYGQPAQVPVVPRQPYAAPDYQAPRMAGPPPPARPVFAGNPWQGVSGAELRSLVDAAPLPSRSPALQHALKRLLEATGTGGDFTGARQAILQHAGLEAAPAQGQLAAMEQAAKTGAVSGVALAQAYRSQHFDKREIATILAGPAGAEQRAILFQAVAAASAPAEKAKLLQGLAAGAAKAGLEAAVAEAIQPELRTLRPEPSLLAYADTVIRLSALARDGAAAQGWIALAEANRSTRDAALRWRILFEVAGQGQAVGGKAALDMATGLALAGGLTPLMQNRLVTVLDALGYQVPIPLWEAASRGPQPEGGYLPETGYLSRLSDAAGRGETGRTLLMVMHALGPDGPSGAHLIVLGDCVRALKQVGLEETARGVAFESLEALLPARATQG